MKPLDFFAGHHVAETPHMLYCAGYKYQTRCDMLFYIGFPVEKDIDGGLVLYRKDGWMLVRKYFSFDGCSGPTWDDASNIRACCGHDAGYNLISRELLPMAAREWFDNKLADWMMQDRGKWQRLGKLRAKFYRWAVDTFAEKSAMPCSLRKVLCSPPQKDR